MKIRVTKVMANYINKMAKAGELHIDCAWVHEFTFNEYKICVGDPWVAEDYGDYNWETGGIRAIQIDYPAEYYACPKYITSKELIETARRNMVTTEKQLKEMLKQIIEI